MTLAAFELDDFGGRGFPCGGVTGPRANDKIVSPHGNADAAGSGLEADVVKSVFFKKLWRPFGQKTLIAGYTHTLPSLRERQCIAPSTLTASEA